MGATTALATHSQHAVTLCGAVLFAALVAFALVATGDDFFGGVIRGGTPANFVFVGLTQAGPYTIPFLN